MDANQLRIVVEGRNRLQEMFEQFFRSDPVTDLLQDMSARLGNNPLWFGVTMEMCDDPSNCFLELLNLSHTSSATRTSRFECFNADTLRYTGKDGGVVLSGHHCPRCWVEWRHLEEAGPCPRCGLKSGTGFKALLDAARCPTCRMGFVTATQPTCEECGNVVDPQAVAWG